MNDTIYLSLSLLIGVGIGYQLNQFRKTNNLSAYNSKRYSKRNLKINSILLLYETNEFIQSRHVEKFLDVSRGTARNYLSELEKLGLIKKVGTRGRSVHYILN